MGEEGGKKKERGERGSLDEERAGKGKTLWRRQEPQRKKVNERSLGKDKEEWPGGWGEAGRRARRPPLPAALSPPARPALRRLAAMLGGQAPAAL